MLVWFLAVGTTGSELEIANPAAYLSAGKWVTDSSHGSV